jgi:hypothetical protein
MNRHSVAILGGYGVFGSRIARSLARHPELDLIVAGRDGTAASAFAASIGADRARACSLDIADADQVQRLLEERPAAIIDTAGPFQNRDYSLALRCAEAGIHYVDIADGRSHVAGITALDPIARARDVLVVSGASTVPAISTAMVSDLAPAAGEVVEIDVGITPGHRAPRGLATVRAILGYCGQPIPALSGDAPHHGWGGLTHHRYPSPVGRRWLSHVDTPERVLWRSRYPALRRGSIRAGLEIGALHLGLSALSRGVRVRLIRSLTPYAAAFIRIADACDRFGSDIGAMHVRVVTRDATARLTSRLATLVAERGDGPQIPAAPAALLVKKLLAIPGYVPISARGARPCVDLLTVSELLTELRGYAIRYVVEP